jgi:GxxExxY protein
VLGGLNHQQYAFLESKSSYLKYLSRNYLDFLVENKIIVEIKSSSKFYPKDIKQVLGYLKAKNIKLGILICFGKNGLIYKRILRGN